MIESCAVKSYLESDDQLEPVFDPIKRIELFHLTDLISVMFAHWGDQQVKKYST